MGSSLCHWLWPVLAGERHGLAVVNGAPEDDWAIDFARV